MLAHPLITPASIASVVFEPIALGEVAASILGSFDVILFKLFICKFIPGAIAPPINSLSLFTISNEVAVPKSIAITGSLYNTAAPVAFAILSAPTSSGSSTFKLITVAESLVKIYGVILIASVTAFLN